MSIRRVPILKDTVSVTRNDGDPPAMPDGLWIKPSDDDDATILAETSVTGLQLKMSSTGRLYYSDAADGKYHQFMSQGYLDSDALITSPSSGALNPLMNAAPNFSNRVITNATDNTVWFPASWGAPICVVSYDWQSANVVATELEISLVGVTNTPVILVNGPGDQGSFIVDLNLFPEFKSGASDVTVSNLVRPLNIGLRPRLSSGSLSPVVTNKFQIATLPGALISNT